MKVIDLLNKIANGEEVPKKIRFDNKEWNRVYGEKNVIYIDDNDDSLFIYFFRRDLTFTLNDEVEILEEKKIPEKLEGFNLTTYSRDDKDLGLELHYTGVSNTFNDVYFKINEIIDFLKSKGE